MTLHRRLVADRCVLRPRGSVNLPFIFARLAIWRSGMRFTRPYNEIVDTAYR